MKTIIPIILVPFLLRCAPIEPGPPHDPEAGSVDDCPAACDNLAVMQCPGWEGSPGPDEVYGTEDDVPCLEVCEDFVEFSNMTLYPACTAKATSCEEALECFG